jgi:hypothetical protein
MTDDGSVISGSAGECATIADFLLYVADDGAFWALPDGEDVTDREGRFLAAVYEGAGVETFCGDKGFFAEFVAVWVAEDDSGEGCTAGGRLKVSIEKERDGDGRTGLDRV